MPDQNAANPAATAAPVVSDFATTAAPSDVVVAPNIPDLPDPAQVVETPGIYAQVAGKISDAHNVLIALSGDPSVDELSAAIGLSLYLDKLGKRATAIYSGQTPNALEFLKPEETFEPSVDSLQDFVIALNKDKADHLRYKLDGDYVKIYITPYRTRISEEDLDFSYGDFNVDLVLALDVANGIDLDSALREHGRIMHDAVIINITTGNPGKFGEIEWSDKSASSVSEMIAKLLLSVKSKVEIDKEEATAFLTGIVAATNRFSNAYTTPETMQIASRLMELGANQQLIAKNITPDIENEMFSITNSAANKSKRKSDPTKLDIEHGNEEGVDETKVVDEVITEKESTLLDDLKAAEASLSQAGAETTPDTSGQPVKLDELSDTPEPTDTAPAEPTEPSIELPTVEPLVSETEPVSEPESVSEPKPELKLEPESTPTPEPTPLTEPTPVSDFTEPSLPPVSTPTTPAAPIMSNPATTSAPDVASSPEINGVPEMSYVPMPDDAVLPPPPAPPIDMSSAMPTPTDFTAPVSTEPVTPIEPAAPIEPATPIEPAMPVTEPTPEPLGPQPAMQDQVYTPQASDPGAFKIPGINP